MLTVIIPCYRAKTTVNRAINSILQANGTQVLAIDDACPDGTGAYLAERYGQECRVKVITNNKNLGLGATRNIGISQSTTELVAFLDADDYWTQSELITLASEEMSKLNAEVGLMPVVIDIKNDSKPCAHSDYERIVPLAGKSLNIKSTPALSVVMPCWSMIYRRQFLINNGIKFQRRKFEDHDFGLEIVLTASSLLVFTSSPVVHYDKTREGTLSSSKLTEADHRLFLAHVARVAELLNSNSDLPRKSRAERANHYTFRLVFQLLEIEQLTDEMIQESLALVHSLRPNSQVSDLTNRSVIQSSITKRLLTRHPYLAHVLDRALVKQARFAHFIRLLRFVRKRNLGKARALTKLGLRAVSMPWK